MSSVNIMSFIDILFQYYKDRYSSKTINGNKTYLKIEMFFYIYFDTPYT